MNPAQASSQAQPPMLLMLRADARALPTALEEMRWQKKKKRMRMTNSSSATLRYFTVYTCCIARSLDDAELHLVVTHLMPWHCVPKEALCADGDAAVTNSLMHGLHTVLTCLAGCRFSSFCQSLRVLSSPSHPHWHSWPCWFAVAAPQSSTGLQTSVSRTRLGDLCGG